MCIRDSLWRCGHLHRKGETVSEHGGVRVCVAPRSYVSQVGQPSVIDLITVDWASQPVPNQKVTVGVSKAKWNTVQKKAEDGQFYWVTEVEETPVMTKTVTTDAKGEAVFTWTPKEGGQYKINATVVDSKGNACLLYTSRCV